MGRKELLGLVKICVLLILGSCFNNAPEITVADEAPVQEVEMVTVTSS